MILVPFIESNFNSIIITFNRWVPSTSSPKSILRVDNIIEWLYDEYTCKIGSDVIMNSTYSYRHHRWYFQPYIIKSQDTTYSHKSDTKTIYHKNFSKNTDINYMTWKSSHDGKTPLSPPLTGVKKPSRHSTPYQSTAQANTSPKSSHLAPLDCAVPSGCTNLTVVFWIFQPPYSF